MEKETMEVLTVSETKESFETEEKVGTAETVEIAETFEIGETFEIAETFEISSASEAAETFEISDDSDEIGADEEQSEKEAAAEEKEKKIKKLGKFFTFRTISSKILITCLFCCALLLFCTLKLFSLSAMGLESDLIGSRLNADIIHLEDIIIGGDDYSEWHAEDGYLYCGNVCLGNGTEETAKLDPFYETQEKTGTFCYTFIKSGDEGLEWSGDQETGYMEGHYLRVAGSTKDPNGNSIVGTYMDKKIADILDANGTYEGEANVVGGMIYCVYNTLCDDDGNVVGAIVVGRSMTELKNQVAASEKQIASIIILLIVICGASILLITRKWAKAVTKVSNYLGRIESGELPEDKLEIKANDEIADMVVSVNDMVEGLKEKQRIGSELAVATSIQISMLPKILPDDCETERYRIFASMNAAKEVGGDLYDFFRIDDEHIAIAIADVSGKGVPAALFMAITKSVIKNSTNTGMEPSEVLENVNNILCDGNDQGMFVTALMGIVDLKTGILKLANAGHNPPLLGRNGEFTYQELKPGIVLAFIEEMKYTQKEIQLEPGDKLYLYTDGVTEATNEAQELYGEDRLKKFLDDHADEKIEKLTSDVFEDVMRFTGEAPQFDDVTMLMFEYLGTK